MTPLLALVPVPKVPPPPPPSTTGSTLSWTLGIIGLTALLGFTVFTIRNILNVPMRKHEVRIAAWMSFGGLAMFALCYVEWRIHDYRQDVARDAWWEVRQQADDTAQEALEDMYGLTFTDPILVFPIEPERTPWDMEVELADGTPSTCWLKNVDQHFAITCGTDVESAVPPAPVDVADNESAGEPGGRPTEDES